MSTVSCQNHPKVFICNMSVFTKSISLFTLTTIFLELIHGKCNVCQANGAACVNSTSFHMCYGNSVPYLEHLYHCKKGFVCSNLNAICVQSLASRPAVCGDTSLCGQCSAHRNHVFACTSRGTFRMCYGASSPRGVVGYCPDGYVCNANSNTVCVQPSEAKDVTCDLWNPIDGNYLEYSTSQKPTTTIATVESTTVSALPSLSAQEICDVEQKVGVFQIPGDVLCLEYVRCYRKKKLIYGSLERCRVGTYFSGSNRQCMFAKPSYCL